MEVLRLISDLERVQTGLLLIKRVYMQQIEEKILHMLKPDNGVVDTLTSIANNVQTFKLNREMDEDDVDSSSLPC